MQRRSDLAWGPQVEATYFKGMFEVKMKIFRFKPDVYQIKSGEKFIF